MAEVRPKRVLSKDRGSSKRELYATVCYYYPQYTLKDVEDMPARDVQLLLKTAQRLQAANYLNLTQIAAAPHTDKGKGVKSLIERYKDIAK